MKKHRIFILSFGPLILYIHIIGTTYGLIDLNVKTKTPRIKHFKASSQSPNRPKFKEAKCFSSEVDDSFEIHFSWKSKQISLRKFIYRVEYIDPQADSNPLYR